MKKLFVLLLMLLLLASCTGVGGKQQESQIQYGSMYIEEAKLLQKEADMMTLLTGGTMAHLFDYRVDDSIKTVRIQMYKLDENGAWSPRGGSAFGAKDDKKGRIALMYGAVEDPVEVVVQSGSGRLSIGLEKDALDTTRSLSNAVSWLYEKEIEPEAEIPIAIQVITSGGTIASYDVESFATPERYAEHDYDAVYAITVQFSEKEL